MTCILQASQRGKKELIAQYNMLILKDKHEIIEIRQRFMTIW